MIEKNIFQFLFYNLEDGLGYWPVGCRWRGAGSKEAGLHLVGFGSGTLAIGQHGDGLGELEEYLAVDVAFAGSVAARRRTRRPIGRDETAAVATPINPLFNIRHSISIPQK